MSFNIETMTYGRFRSGTLFKDGTPIAIVKQFGCDANWFLQPRTETSGRWPFRREVPIPIHQDGLRLIFDWLKQEGAL